MVLLPVSACTWVPLTDEGSSVQVRTVDQVQGCERMSRVSTTSQGQDRRHSTQRGKGARGTSNACAQRSRSDWRKRRRGRDGTDRRAAGLRGVSLSLMKNEVQVQSYSHV